MKVVLAIAMLVVCGCGEDRLYTGPVQVPKAIGVGIGEYTAIAPRVYEGSRAPMDVPSLAARCVATSVCRALVRESKVYVFGLAAGQSELVIDTTQPVTGRSRVRRVEVEVTAPSPGQALAIGSASRPAVGERLALAIEGEPFMCANLGPNRTGALNFSCAAPMKLDGKTYVYRQTDAQITALVTSVSMCAAPETGPLTSVFAYAPVNKLLGTTTSACPPL